MGVGPKKCRENALRCRELATLSESSEHAQLLSQHAMQWIKLAEELEQAQLVRGDLLPFPKES
jgi:hypothetical protein